MRAGSHLTHLTDYGPSLTSLLVIDTRGFTFGPREDEIVRTARARGCSWAGVAKMIGRSEPDTREHYDPKYVPLHRAQRSLYAVPAQPPAPVFLPGSVQHRVLNALLAGCCWAGEVSRATDLSDNWAAHTLNELKTAGQVEHVGKRSPWRLNDDGRALLAQLNSASGPARG